MPRVERPLVAVPDRRKARRCRERTDPQIVAWRDRGDRRRYPTWHRTVKVRDVGKEPVVIAGDICVDRSPPMVFDLVADEGNECSDDPKMAITLLTDEPTGIGS